MSILEAAAFPYCARDRPVLASRPQDMPSKPTILHLVTDLRIGGTQKILLERVRNPGPFQHRVLVFNRITGDGTGPDWGAEFERAGVTVRSLGLARARQAVLALLTGALDRRLRAALEGIAPSLIHSTLYHTHLLAARLAPRLCVPFVASKEATDGWMGPLTRRLEGRALARAAALVAVSQAARQVLLRRGLPASRIRVVPNGLDPERPGSWSLPWDPGATAGASTTREARLLGVGRLSPVKGWQDLLAALPDLRRKHPELSLDLLGDGPMEGKLKSQAERLGLADCVRIHPTNAFRPPEGRPRATDGPIAASGAPNAGPILVVPSREEGFGLILLEAMARALPIVATRAGGIPEVVRDGREALLAEPGDPASLAAAIGRLLDDPKLAGCLAAAGPERVRAFPLERMVGAYHDLYREMLERRE